MVTRNNGITTISFTRPRNSGDSEDDFSLEECRYFFFGYGGTADIDMRAIGYHPQTPIISNDRICLPTVMECPGNNRCF